MAGRGRSGADEPLALLVASGHTVAEAAKLAGVGERTVYRRLSDDIFLALVRDLRQQMIDAGLGKLTALVGKAVDTLESNLTAPERQVQVRAANCLLGRLLDLRSALDTEERLARLEALLCQHEGSTNGKP